jgi:hypothetical protein
MTYLINDRDLNSIVSNAKQNMFHLNLPLTVSKVDVERGEIPSLAILESVLMFLNGKGLLTQLVSVDYTDPCTDHDMDSMELTEKKLIT